jgi:2-polyprenyl-6-methoxyphenol hydroxylase-like FAD-dependent oxidoreductase
VRVLVVGAGLAGCAAAVSLERQGHDVTVVDAVRDPYGGGYQLQLDLTAQRMLDRLGMADTVERLSRPSPTIVVRRGERTLTTLRPEGYRIARRGDLVGSIVQHTAARLPLHLGRELTGIEQRAQQVIAHFADGSAEPYDLLLGADGLRSTVRRLVLGPDRALVHENGWTNVWIDVPVAALGPDTAELHVGNGMGAQFFPYPEGEEALIVAYLHTGPAPSPVGALVERVRGVLGVGDKGRLVADALTQVDPAGVRLTRFAQVRTPVWHAGRVVLIGDSAHCVDPLSGVGAHASLLGATTFADALHRARGDIDTAARAYTARVTPFVRTAQHATAGIIELASAASAAQRLAALPELLRAAVAALGAGGRRLAA